MIRLLYRITGVVAALALAACLGWSALLGWEDRLGRGQTRGAIERAIRLAPGDARNYAALGSLGGADRTSALELAVRTNPYDSTAWIELGLDAELRGERGRAERCLLEAARVDKTYTPRWTLANFYFRANDRAKFWPWLRGAARMSYGDPAPLARLAWGMAEDAPEGLAALGDRARVLAAYVSLLLDKGRMGPAEAAASRLVGLGGRDALSQLLLACDHLLDGGQPAAALRLWNRLAGAGLVAGPKLDPERGPWLANGDFAEEFLGRGFGWRMAAVAGVEAIRLAGQDGVRFQFSGREPEGCMLLEQPVAIAPNRSWRLSFEYRTAGTPPETGFHWRTTGAEWTAPPAETWTGAEFEFKAPPGASALPLKLTYERAPGTVREEGVLWLRRVRLERIG